MKRKTLKGYNKKEKNIRKGEKQMKMKNEKGITLIALVITIIVMLILVAVTVNVALNGGLIGKTQEAKTKTEEAQIQERDILTGRIKIGDIWYDSLDEYLNGNPSENQESDDSNETLKVELELDEANVNKNNAKVQVKVTDKKTNEAVSEGLTYTYSLAEDGEKTVTNTENSHEFTGLDKTKSYTINVEAKDSNGNVGTASIKVISFSYLPCARL